MHAFVERSCLYVATLLDIEDCEPVERRADLVVIATKCHFLDRNCALVEGLGRRILALLHIDDGQPVECDRNLEVVCTAAAFGQQERLLGWLDRFGKPPGLKQLRHLAIESRDVVVLRTSFSGTRDGEKDAQGNKLQAMPNHRDLRLQKVAEPAELYLCRRR